MDEPFLDFHQWSTMTMVLLSLSACASLWSLALLARCKVKTFFHRSRCCRCCCKGTANSTIDESSGQAEEGLQSDTPQHCLDGGMTELETSTIGTGKEFEQYEPHEDHSTMYGNILLSTPLRLSSPTLLKVHYRGRKTPPWEHGEENKENTGRYGLTRGNLLNAHQINSLRGGDDNDDDNDKWRENAVSGKRVSHNCSAVSEDGNDQSTTISWRHFNDEADGNTHNKESFQKTREEEEITRLSASSLLHPLTRPSLRETARKAGIVNITAERCIHMAQHCIASAHKTATFHRKIPSRMMYDALLNVRSAQVSLLAAELMLKDAQAENLVELECAELPDSRSWESEEELKLEDMVDLPSENRTSLSFLSQVTAAGDLEFIPVQTPLTKYMEKYASTSKARHHAVAKLNPSVLKVKPFSSSHLVNGSMTDGIKKTLFSLMGTEPEITEGRPGFNLEKLPRSAVFKPEVLSRSNLEPKRVDLKPDIKSSNRSFPSLRKISSSRSSTFLETRMSSVCFKGMPDNKKPLTSSKELMDMYIHIALMHRHKEASGKSISQGLKAARAIDSRTDSSLRNDSVSDDGESDLQENSKTIQTSVLLELGRDLKVERSGFTTSADTEYEDQENKKPENPDDQEESPNRDTSLLRSHVPQVLLQIGNKSKQEPPPEDVYHNLDQNIASCSTEDEAERSSNLFKQKHQRQLILLKTLKSSLHAVSKANGSSFASIQTSNTKMASQECVHPTCSAADNHSESYVLQHGLERANSEIANLSEDSAFVEEQTSVSGECPQSCDEEAEEDGDQAEVEKEEGEQESENGVGEGKTKKKQGELKSTWKPYTTLQNSSAKGSWISQSIVLMSTGERKKQSPWQYSANSLPANSKWKSSVSSDDPSKRDIRLNDAPMSFTAPAVSKAAAALRTTDSDASRHLAFRHSQSVPWLSTSLDARRAFKNDSFETTFTPSSSGHESAPNFNEVEYQKLLTSLRSTNSGISFDLPAPTHAKKSVTVEESQILHSKPPPGHSSRHRKVATSDSPLECCGQQEDKLREARRRSSALERILQYEANESFRIPSSFGEDEPLAFPMQERVQSADNSKDNIITPSKTGDQTSGMLESLIPNDKHDVFSPDRHRDWFGKESGLTDPGLKIKLCDYTCHPTSFEDSSGEMKENVTPTLGDGFKVKKYGFSSREVPLVDHHSTDEFGSVSRCLDSDGVFENTLSGSNKDLTSVDVSRNISSVQGMTPLKNNLDRGLCDIEALKIQESEKEAVEEVSICMEEDDDRTFASSLANYKTRCNKQSPVNRCSENSDSLYSLPCGNSQIQYHPSDETYTVEEQCDSIEVVDEEENKPRSVVVTHAAAGRIRTQRNTVENLPVYTEVCETQASSPSRLFDNVFRHDLRLPTKVGSDDCYAYSHIHSTSTCVRLGCGTSTFSTSACRSPVCSTANSAPKEVPSNSLSSFEVASDTKRRSYRARSAKSDVPMFPASSSVRSKPAFTKALGTPASLLRNSTGSENAATTDVVNSMAPLEPDCSQFFVKTHFVKKTPFQGRWSAKTRGSTTRTSATQSRGAVAIASNGAPGKFKKAAAATAKKSAAAGLISKRIRELMKVDCSACAPPAAVSVSAGPGCCNVSHPSSVQASINTSDTSVLGRPCSIMGMSTISFSSPATHSTPIPAFDRFQSVRPGTCNGQQQDPARPSGVEGIGYYRVLQVSDSASFYQDPYPHSHQESAKPCTQYVT